MTPSTATESIVGSKCKGGCKVKAEILKSSKFQLSEGKEPIEENDNLRKIKNNLNLI